MKYLAIVWAYVIVFTFGMNLGLWLMGIWSTFNTISVIVLLLASIYFFKQTGWRVFLGKVKTYD